MFKNSLKFVMKESGEKRDIKPVFSKEEAEEYNQKKYGVFMTVNGFKERRIKENLLNINAWAVDIDDISKHEQEERIQKSPLPPSLIVESKNGYHIYWFAQDAEPEKYDEIQLLLISFFKGDMKARDICRILRFPGFLHWKDENDPYLVKVAWKDPSLVYSQEKMLTAFGKKKKTFPKELPRSNYNGFDNMKALEILSGRPEVNGETFTFRKNTSGYQILVNGKSTSNWIDKQGLIGSYERGGCCWVNWVMWYGYSKEQAVKIGENYGIKTK